MLLLNSVEKTIKNILLKNKWRLRFLLYFVEIYKKYVIKILRFTDGFLFSSFHSDYSTPRTYVSSTLEYITNSANDDFFIDVYTQEKLNRKLPNYIDEEISQEGFKENIQYVYPEQKVYILKNIRFWGHYGGTVITPLNQVLADISPDVWGIEKHTIFTKFNLPPCIEIKGKTAILSTPEAASNYWHWTFDLVPRLHLIVKSGVNINSIDNFIINHTQQQYQLEYLQEIGIPDEKVICCNSSSHFFIEYAIVPNLCPSDHGVPSWKINYLRNLNIQKLETQKKRSKLYISRQHSSQRRLINENEIETILTEKGFSTIYLEDYKLNEQRNLFSQAECVMGIHGAGFSNIIFCQPNTKIIEIFPPNYIKYYYWFIANLLNLEYSCVVGESVENTSQTNNMIAEDVFLNHVKFRNYLNNI